MSVAVEVMTSALVMGILGSLHCAGMCGPLAVAGCSKSRGVSGAPGYFAGRLVAYATLGAVVGHLGKHAFCILPMSTAQVVAVALTALPAAARGLSILLFRKPPSDVIPCERSPLRAHG
ncbi:MAG: sulfite exporter TauE/SafE family protein [Polyangiaceae bacterium]